MRTAAVVPSCTTAVNAEPGSSQPAKAGTIRRWAVLEIGRNSVSPWTMPRTMASNQLIELPLDDQFLGGLADPDPPHEESEEPDDAEVVERVLQVDRAEDEATDELDAVVER